MGNFCHPRGTSHEAAAEIVANNQVGMLERDMDRACQVQITTDGGAGRGFEDWQLTEFKNDARNFMSKYDITRRLSAGAQGVTYLANEKSTGKEVVVKKPNNPQDTADFTSLSSKTHPNIVRVYECFQNPMETFIVMELAAGGDLFGAVESLTGELTENWCAAVMMQVMKGVNYIHTQFQESHNDIKPENILLDRKCINVQDVPRAMVGDFGCLSARGAVNQDTGGGDPRYRAPETFRGALFGVRTDTWSLGVTLYELVSGGLLIYLNEPNLGSYAKFLNSDLATRFFPMLEAGFPVDLSIFQRYKRLTNLLSKLLDVRPEARITLGSALQHPFFQNAASGAEVKKLGKGATKHILRRGRNHKMNGLLLDMLGRQLQGESIEYYSDLWDKYDTDGDGVMDYHEFRKMLKSIDFKSKRVRISTLFACADTDNSQTIDFNEFVAFMFDPDQLDENEKMEYFQSVYYEIAGADGLISLEELASVFPDSSKKEVLELFRDIDADGSGYISVDEFQEFVDGL